MSQFLGRWLGAAVVMGGLLGGAATTQAAEHGGKEHGGHEHSGTATTPATAMPAVPAVTATMPVAPSAEAIRQAIRDYDGKIEAAEGALKIKDNVTGQTRSLKLERVHERVGKTGDKYYSCADTRDTATNDLVDVDFDVSDAGGALSVVDVRIHKVNGTPRYTYDDKDNRIPVSG